MAKKQGKTVTLTIDGKKIPLNDFVATALANVVIGFIYSLKDTDAKKEIKIKVNI